MALFRKSKKRAERRNLEQLKTEHETHMRDLEEVRGDIERLMDSAQGLTILLDKKTPWKKRAQVLHEIVMNGGRITRAIDKNDQMVRHRFAVMMLGEGKNWIGICLMYFSREFGELEREAVKTRAQIIALQNKVGIEKIDYLNPPEGEPNNRLCFIGSAETWEEVVTKVKKLYETGCIQFFAAAHPDEIRRGFFATSPLSEPAIDMLPSIVNGLYPDFDKIKMYINELYAPDGSVQKQLVAVFVDAGDELFGDN